MCNRTVGVSSASLPNSQFGDSREDSLSYGFIIVIYVIIHIMSLRSFRYSFYSYLGSEIYSFLNPIVLKRIKWIILRSRFFLTYRFASKDDKPYSATFGQVSSKSDVAY